MMEQMERIGVAQAVSPLEGDIESTFSGPGLKRLCHRGRFQGPTRGSEAKEDLSVLTIPRDPLEIIIEGRADLVSQREFQGIACLCLTEPNTPGSPVDIVQFQSNDFTTPQAISRHQREHRVISFPHGCISVNRMKKSFNGCPR